MATDTDSPDADAPNANDVDAANAVIDAASAHPVRIADVETGDREPALVARIERYDDAPDECTIYPADASATELPTTWLTAEEGSFVALETVR